MRKTLIYKKRVQDETGREYILWYSLVIRVAEHGRIYGVEIEKTNEYGRQERALIAGISEEKKEPQYFLERLWCGAAMPAELNALYDEFTELVNKADAITDDLDARYEAYADAEAFMLDHALTIPSNFDIGWELTHINDYTKQNAMFGIQNLKYKNWETSTDAYTAEDYAGFQETWNTGSAE